MTSAPVRTFRRLALTAGAAVSTTALVAGGLAAPAHAATPEASASATWLAKQLDDGLVQSEYQDEEGTWIGYTDHGLTLDVFFALERLEVKPAKRQAIIDAMEPETDDYVRAFGTEYAGALGKLVTALQANGTRVGRYADGELLADLEDRVVTEGAEKGRAVDDPEDGDSSNSFGQSYVVTALAGADSDLEGIAARYLVKQQCDAGFVTEGMSAGGCDAAGDPTPSVDATATVVSALLDAAPQLRPAIRKEARAAAELGARWLARKQAADGAIAGGRNANSTGLAATALLDAGWPGKAKDAAQWLDGLRVTPRLVRTTAYRDRDLGAVAYDRDQLDAGKDFGIARSDRYVWRRSTAQAAPALDAL